MVPPVHGRHADAQHERRQPVSGAARESPGRDQHDHRTGHVSARERAAMNSPALFDQVDERRERPAGEIDLLQMAQRVMRAFDGEEDEYDVAEIIGHAGRGDERGEIFAAAANPQMRAESDRQQKVARVYELHILVQPVIAELLQPHRRMDAEHSVIGLDQILVEPAGEDSMDDQTYLLKKEKEYQRGIPVAEQAEDGN